MWTDKAECIFPSNMMQRKLMTKKTHSLDNFAVEKDSKKRSNSNCVLF